MRQRVQLRLVQVTSFRRSEKTSFEALPAEERDAMRPSEAICFVSKSGNQVVFVYRPTSVPLNGSGPVDVLPSSRLRLGRGRWNRYMLQNYANEVGLELVGLPRFEKILEAEEAARRKKKKEK